MLRIFFFLLLIIFNQLNLSAKENETFLMLKNNKVNVRYGPSFESPIKFFYKKKSLPVKIVDKKENWRKIIDSKKNGGWIHTSQLKESKSFIIKEDKIIFQKPSFFSKPIAKVEKGKLIVYNKCDENWCKVNIQNYKGWIQANNIWGEIN